jgi:hypothetical protein
MNKMPGCQYDKPGLYKGSVIACYCMAVDDGKVHPMDPERKEKDCPRKKKIAQTKNSSC